MSDLSFGPGISRFIRPLPPRDSFTFITEKVRTPPGKPFNAHDYPWVKGICEAFDDPEVRVIAMQFAARLGKSMTAQALLVAGLEHDPDVGMIAMSTKKLLEQTVEDKYYKILENTNATRHKIPPEYARNKQEISFGAIKVYGAWSGSTTTLADKPPKYKHAGEIDKWETAESREADSLKLFMQRGIEIPDRKSIVESTPDLEHTSRIKRYLDQGWNARFLVPCPKCGKFIQLIPGDGKEIGGIKFDKLDGKVNPRHAYDTARYQCQECGEEWGDQWRRPAIQQGIWCPEGGKVEVTGDGPKLTGQMIGDPQIASFQLSRIYAPTFKFGDIAKQIANCVVDPENWQDTRNSWFGVTHALRSTQLPWDKTAERLSTIKYNLGEIPGSGLFLTCGIDVQQDHFVFVVVAWGRYGVGWIVDYGTVWTVAEIREVLNTQYKHLDGGPGMRVSMTLIDSGEGTRQDEIIEICRMLNREKGPWVWPCKGSKSALQSGRPYKKQKFEDMQDRRGKHGRHHGLAGFFHVTVNTPWTQTWMNKALFYKEPGTPKSISIPQDVVEDEDFVSQLVNEKLEGKDTTTGHGSSLWVVVDPTIPWDFRDATRYARCGADLFVRSSWIRLPGSRRIAPAQVAKPAKKTKKANPKASRQPKAVQAPQKRFVRKSTSSSNPFIRGS